MFAPRRMIGKRLYIAPVSAHRMRREIPFIAQVYNKPLDEHLVRL
jgi:hypothetical protein